MNALHEYTTTEVSAAIGLTPRQLQWLDEKSIIMPRHIGHKRYYSTQEVREARLVAELRKKGLSLQKCRGIVKQVRNRLTYPDMYVVTDGKNAFVDTDSKRIVNIFRGSKMPMLLVFLPGIK